MKVKDEFKIGKHGIGYVSNSFLSEFGDKEILSGKVLSFQKLNKTMSDSEIISELKIQECSFGDIIATLNSDNSELKDGNWNLFYPVDSSHVVGVRWHSVSGGWGVDGWGRGGGWLAGRRVFSPATV